MEDLTPPATLGEIGLQRFAPYLMNRIMGRYNASIQATLAEGGLTTAKLRTLAVLTSHNGLMINELSVYCVIEQSTMSRTLAAMMDDGLVRREEDENDSRARRIYITEQGRAVFDEFWPAMGLAAEGMLTGISSDEREAFLSTLQKILGNVRRNPF